MKLYPQQSLTFDDVLLAPQRADVLPKDIDISAKIGAINLHIPIISSDMDTVTEDKMAIALARLGGLGIIHKNMPPEKQAKMVVMVKKSESGIIKNPISLRPDATIKEAVGIMKENNISGIPITKNKKLVGILTNRDLRFIKNFNLLVSSLMTKKLITAPPNTTLEKAKKILHKHRIEKLPLINEQGELKGLITVKDIQKITEFPKASKDKQGRLRVAASIGIKNEALQRLSLLAKEGLDAAVISTAHGHSKNVIDTIRNVRKKYSDLVIIAGNVATKEGVRDLARAGANAIKIGIGAGSICTTRIIAGAGMPQLSAIMGCAKNAPKNVSIIADGGIRYSGDITKALAAGAGTVILGNLLAGVDESPGELIYLEGKTYKSYRGMGSVGALRMGSRERYNQEESAKTVPEGVEGRIIYKGALKGVMEQLVGGVKSGMGLSGAKNIKDLQRKAKFVLISDAAKEESHPHNVFITEEAPNYPGKI